VTPGPLRALVVDDEPLARDELGSLLAETGAFALVGGCGDAMEALQAIRRERPDVVFLDVQMPVVSGFELLGMLDEDLAPAVVFVTAHDAFALRAFEENAIDYLLKPVSRERLQKTVEKLRRRPGARPALPLAPLTRIPCLGARSVKLVPVAEIELVRSGPAGVFVVTAAGEFFTELTLKVLEDRAGLLRCHKQHLVNLDRVDEMDLGDEETPAVLRTRSGHAVPVSRRSLPAVRERLGI
jgi:two-component system, LytTR family, response regulator